MAELTEEMKFKESRWMAHNNRQKEKIEGLEQEKLELKKELQLIEKQRIESLMNSNANLSNNNPCVKSNTNPNNNKITSIAASLQNVQPSKQYQQMLRNNVSQQQQIQQQQQQEAHLYIDPSLTTVN